jgi:hypothetical protein
MAGLVRAIYGLNGRTKDVDARDKPGHDEKWTLIAWNDSALTR